MSGKSMTTWTKDITDMKDFKFQKVLSPLQAWSYAYGCIMCWGAFVMTATMFLPQGGVVGSLLAYPVGGFFIILIAMNYHYLSSLCPANGGIFYLLQNTMGRGHAFAASWAICFAHLLIIPLNARALAQLIRAVMLEYFQVEYHVLIPGTKVLVVDFFMIFLTLICFAYVNFKGIRVSASVQTTGAVILAAGIVLMFFMALFSGVDIREKMTPAFYPGSDPVVSFMLIFIMIPWAFVGFDSAPALSREAAFSKKLLGKIMIMAILFGTFSYMSHIVITLLGAPQPWPEYVHNIGKGLESIAVVAAIRRLYGTGGLILALITLLGGIVTGVNGSIANVSRLFYTMSRSNSLFPVLGKTNDKGVPDRAINSAVIASLVLVLISTTFNTVEMVASICTAFGYGYCSLSALLNARKQGNRRYMFTGATGLLVCIVWLVFLSIPILPIKSFLSAKLYVSLGVWVFIGIWGYAITCRKPDTILDT